MISTNNNNKNIYCKFSRDVVINLLFFFRRAFNTFATSAKIAPLTSSILIVVATRRQFDEFDNWCFLFVDNFQQILEEEEKKQTLSVSNYRLFGNEGDIDRCSRHARRYVTPLSDLRDNVESVGVVLLVQLLDRHALPDLWRSRFVRGVSVGPLSGRVLNGLLFFASFKSWPAKQP